MLLRFCKPFKPVSTDTIAHWLKKVLENAGIDINKYGAHSTRAASTSAAKAANVSVKTIMDAAGWANAETFSKFYDKPISATESVYFGVDLLKAQQLTLIKHLLYHKSILSCITLMAICFKISRDFVATLTNDEVEFKN